MRFLLLLHGTDYTVAIFVGGDHNGHVAHVDNALAALGAAGLLAEEMGVIHCALTSNLLDDNYALLAGAYGIVVGIAGGAQIALELLELVAVALDELIAGAVGAGAGVHILTHVGLEQEVKADDNIVGAGSTCLVEEQLFLKVALGGAELVGLYAVHVHAGHHEVNAGDGVGDAFAQYAKHLGGYGDDIHNGVGPAVVIVGLDYLDVDLFDDVVVFLHERIQQLTANGHFAVRGNVVMFAPFHGIHVEGLDDQTPQVDILCHFCSSAEIFFNNFGQGKAQAPIYKNLILLSDKSKVQKDKNITI